MISDEIQRLLLRKEVVRRIERRFRGSLVAWSGIGSPDDETGVDKTEIFDAYNINESDYEEFCDYEWELQEELGTPNGINFMVHDYTPEETREYCREEYSAELQRRGYRDYIINHRDWAAEVDQSDTVMGNLYVCGCNIIVDYETGNGDAYRIRDPVNPGFSRNVTNPNLSANAA